MKKLLYTIFLFCFLASISSASTNPPETIYSITRVKKSLDYYLEQSALWKEETQQNRENKDAWFNYYKACRMANIMGYSKPFDLTAIEEEIGQAIPDSFEHYYVKHWNQSPMSSSFEYLKKAYAIAPNRYENYPGFVTYYELTRETEKQKEFCEKWYQSGEYSSGILAWNYNVLMSVEKDAILITQADNDTYPIWMLQQVKEVRPDVLALNIYLLENEKYRNAIFAELGIVPLELSAEIDQKELHAAISNHILKNANRSVYMGVAITKELRDKYSQDLYLVGLAFKHSEQSFDNLNVLKDNFENKFLTDYLRIELKEDISASVVNEMNLNYIPAFLLLTRHYESHEQHKKANQLKDLTIDIARRAGRESMVRKHLNGDKQPIAFESIIDVKKLQHGMRYIKDKLYAQEIEVSNGQWEAFLIDLLKQKEFEKLAICKSEKTDWRALLQSKFPDAEERPVYVNKKAVSIKGKIEHTPIDVLLASDPDATDHPVQNISYEAAQIYCEWITNVYNQSKYKKKRFKQVRFRLPTKTEWELAAKAGQEQVPYPWGGYYYKNAKGCYLSNANVSNQAPCDTCPNKLTANDGAFFTVTTDAYFPNDFGLYNMAGNVAEMIDQKGIAKGGSWEDIPEDCQIEASKEYTSPSPAIGFRIFMDVIETK